MSSNTTLRVVLVAVVSIASAWTTAAAGPKTTTLDTDPHLVGWWKFDETGGKTAGDSSKFKHNGTLVGELAFDKNSVEGKIGRALKFTGGDGMVEIKGYKGITGTKPRSVTAWIRTKKNGGEIIAWGESDFGKMFYCRFIRGRIGVTPDGGYLYMKEYINDDKWHHIAAVVHEAELPNLYDHVKLYLDGEVAVIDDIGLLDLWPINTGNKIDVRIGRGYVGLIDDLRLYDRPLSEDEVKALYQLKSNQPLPKPKK